MKKNKTSILFFALVIVSTFASAQNFKHVKTAKDVVENAVVALGGKEYLSTIKTLYTDIATQMDGREVIWRVKEELPNKGSFQIIYQERVVYHNWYDGHTGFEMVNGEKKKADPEEFKAKKYKKNIFNELDFVDPTLWTLELMSEENVNRESCYKIKATLINGEVRHLYFSKSSFLMLREDKVSNSEKDSFSSSFFSDYKKFGPLMFYSVMRFGDADKVQVATIVKLLINEQVGEKDFN